MFKSSVLKKVVASILALAAVSTFSVGSCFAFDGGYDDSDNQTESSTSYESSDEFSCDAYNESSDENDCKAYYKSYEDPDYDLHDGRFGEAGPEESDGESNRAVYDEFKVVVLVVPYQIDYQDYEDYQGYEEHEESDEFAINTNSRGEAYDENHAKQMMTPEESQNSNTDSSSDLDLSSLM